MTKKFEKNPHHTNYLLVLNEDKGDYLSFLSDTQPPDALIEAFSGDDGGKGETALKLNGNWYILNGDYRAEYEAVVNAGGDILSVYNKHKDVARSKWTTPGL